MTLETLKSHSEISRARAELNRQRLSYVTPWPPPAIRPLMLRLGLNIGITVGDLTKSWDVLKTAKFIRENVAVDSPILDIGAYASEILYVLHAMGFASLYGVDLDPRIKEMPRSGQIQYK